ncbi:MAG: hypothetical protein J0I47_06770 [Sphingomonas sp.]|uniref:hypothetical protein n=1 Tax=Sphingomonas sp. TaxID=28214 RepID=UPI001AC311CC|nr:hypothetical protein [Sphingomonas sp.]MBN8807923.1 hypothetical protein [Sphingomonas sp.]
MIGDLIAAAIGKHIDESDGEGGTLGAIVGVLTWKAAKTIIPAAVIVGTSYYVYNRLTGGRSVAPTA